MIIVLILDKPTNSIDNPEVEPLENEETKEATQKEEVKMMESTMITMESIQEAFERGTKANKEGDNEAAIREFTFITQVTITILS